METIKDYRLEYLDDIIPNILMNKFIENNIITVDDLLNTSIEDFKNKPYIGKKVIEHFDSLKNKISISPEEITEIYTKKAPLKIPSIFEENKNILELFELVIDEFFERGTTYNYKTTKAKEINKRYIDIFKKYYGLNSKKFEREKIAKRYRMNRERVRQITIQVLKEIKNLINGEKNNNFNCEIRLEVIEIIQSFKKDLAGISIISEHFVFEWLEEYGISITNEKHNNYLHLLLNLWGYDSLKTSRHYYLQNKLFFVDGSVNKELFLNLSNHIIVFLKKSVIPVSFDDIVIDILEEYDAEDDFILLVCNSLYEVENKGNDYYQIRFEFLSSINDFAYRLLFERQKTLSYNELIHLINKRLIKANKSITIDTLKTGLKKDKNIVPVGRTGIWSLAELKVNTDSQLVLILKTLRTLDKPLTPSEITNYINNHFKRVDVTVRSISSNLRNYKKYFVKLKGNRFILSETSELYKTDIVKTRKPYKKKGVLKTELLKIEIIKVLGSSPSNSMLITEIIKIITSADSSISRMFIYKTISLYPLIFQKVNITARKKAIKLLMNQNNNQNSLNVKYNWSELKNIIIRELSPIFISSIQPNYHISIDDALEAFFKIVTINQNGSCSEQNDLADRILPTLYKFYVGASDRNDKLNYLKQIVTSQESFFKKLLFYVNKPEYLNVKSKNKGLGYVIEKLSKIDSNKNRYLEVNTASNNYFGKHCARAYLNRNIDTHNAHSWTEAEIIETKTSCIVFMVYGCFEYYTEILNIN